MLLLLLFLLGTGERPVYSGRERQLAVRPPRIEAEAVVDGVLDDSVWQHAALLTGFSQYAPSDGVPAADSTHVLIWYSPSAIYFGIRAFEAHGRAAATLADRDNIFGDDNVQVLLGPFNDGKQALLFAVNPLGVQADGTVLAGSNSTLGGFLGGAVYGREQPDLSPDFVFTSRGRVTEWGYEVEVRVPFKSLRYQPEREQTWSINIIRQVKHSGFEDSWVPARRSDASFIGQAGTLVGLTDLHRGLVIDVNPEATEKANGAPAAPGYAYDVGDPQLGLNARWGITNNLTLNGTVRPDFSQVESDAGQLAFDPRQALYFPEKRPFFLDGSELFAVPSNLIYTRRIVQPVSAVKLTGTVSGTDIGLLSAVDQSFASASGTDHPLFNILRAQRRIGERSRLGFAVTDRREAGDANSVAEVDGRVVAHDIYSLDFQLAGSRTSTAGAVTTAPLWVSSFWARGTPWGARVVFTGIADDFSAASGFIGRAGVVHAFVDPSYTISGRPGALVERFVGDIVLDGTWQYQHFIHGRGIQDQKLHFNANTTLRGGWNLAAGYFIESFGYDSALYAGYRLEVPKSGGGLDTIPFSGQPTIINGEWIVQVSTPQWRHFAGSGFILEGHDENFFEWASAHLWYAQLSLSYRPTDRLRTTLDYNWQQINRRTDGSLVNVGRVLRTRVEYQISRPLFIRVVGQYTQIKTDSLHDDSRTNAPILIVGSSGITRSAASATNQLHAEALVSYQPVPGTVMYLGYGGTMNDEAAFRFGNLARTGDTFFAKVSYLFRL